MPQNDEAGSTGTTIPVTTTVTWVTWPVDASSEPGITNFEPACRPSLAAVCLVMATWSVAGAAVVAGRGPLTSRVGAPNGCRSVTSTWTGVPPVPGRSPFTLVNG